MDHFDCVVVGGGAAGTSVAYELSQHASVVLVERESGLGYHSTGRSAAVISENYGPLGWQTLVTASRAFFEAPPAGFAAAPLLHRIGALYFGTAAQSGELKAARDELERRGVPCRLMSAADASPLSPTVRTEQFAAALYEPNCADIDADAMVQGYVRLGKANGLQVVMSIEAVQLERRDGVWHVRTSGAAFTADKVVNAAGSWADDLAKRSSVRLKGLTPYRRTAITFDPPAGANVRTWPMTFDQDETWYFKPEAGRVMVSPVDKTATLPCDAAPEEYDIAVAVDRIETATTMKVNRIVSRWAGLRTFAPDQQPVIGPDPHEPSFHWLAGQGGNGVMGAPAAAKVAAALVLGRNLPDFLDKYRLDLDRILPARLDAAALV
jgi:D-arginine dehydrogenase